MIADTRSTTSHASLLLAAILLGGAAQACGDEFSRNGPTPGSADDGGAADATTSSPDPVTGVAPRDGGGRDAAISPDAAPPVDAGLPDAACVPETDAVLCARAGNDCGGIVAVDACGASRAIASCGTCRAPDTCSAQKPNVCGCKPEADADFCTRLGKTCGTVTAPDSCGVARTVTSCGACVAPQTCAAQVPNVCGSSVCAPESDAAFCTRYGKTCGKVASTDNCGKSRTVDSCGVCSAPQTCGAVTANVCGCAPETDASYCARLGHTCGALSGNDACGVKHDIASCGTCAAPKTCSTTSTCACVPETDAQFCGRLGHKCGALSGVDSCGVTRTVASCGPACSGQACVTGVCSGVCAPGATQCSGTGQQTCGSDGQWGAAAACPTTCLDGVCQKAVGLQLEESRSCARLSGGAVYCWGNGVTTPAVITELKNVDAFALGQSHTCALKNGVVSCFGQNTNGQLGNGTTTASTVPVAVGGLGPIRALAVAGDHTCALAMTGTVSCWGSGDSGELGDGMGKTERLPAAVSGVGGVTGISLGARSACAILPLGKLACWGEGAAGVLGSGAPWANAPLPAAVPMVTGTVAVAESAFNGCALSSGGSVTCWGTQRYGVLGDSVGGTDVLSGPVVVPGVTSATGIALGEFHGCALIGGGTVRCWGSSNWGQLGTGLADGTAQAATEVPNLQGVATLAAGSAHSCAIVGGGKVVCWGYNVDGQIGNGNVASPSDAGVLVPTDVKW